MLPNLSQRNLNYNSTDGLEILSTSGTLARNIYYCWRRLREKGGIVNHFILYTEAEVNAPDRFESGIMLQYLKDKTLSREAENVLAKGKKLWQTYLHIL